MIPGEIITLDGDIELNQSAASISLTIANSGDRPIQVGSHYHFYETNQALQFDREASRGMRLDQEFRVKILLIISDSGFFH